jgi:hypothetical protein
MHITHTVKSLLLLLIAIIIVVLVWNTIWFLAGLIAFAVVVYFVYQLLKGRL